jgi:hypothetical protein
MSSADLDRYAIIDWHRSACLCDVGAPGFSVAVAVTGDGSDALWIIDKAELHAGHPRHGDGDQRHERVGRLPADIRERISPAPRCGRPTKTTGRSCRQRVGAPGEACGMHSERWAAP